MIINGKITSHIYIISAGAHRLFFQQFLELSTEHAEPSQLFQPFVPFVPFPPFVTLRSTTKRAEFFQRLTK